MISIEEAKRSQRRQGPDYENYLRGVAGGKAVALRAITIVNAALLMALVLGIDATNAQQITTGASAPLPQSQLQPALQANCAKLPVTLQARCTAAATAALKCQGRLSPPDRQQCLKTQFAAAQTK